MIKWLPLAAMAALVAMTAGCDQPAPNAQSGGTGQTSAATPSTPEAAPAGGGGQAPAAPAKVEAKDYKSLPGGLKYAILKPGSGPEAKDGQRVTMQYTGWLKDGAKFDSSYDHGGEGFPFTLGAGNVIKGWDEGVKGMKPGEKRQLVIPPSLGYGDSGAGDKIPPGSTLVFDVELVRAE